MNIYLRRIGWHMVVAYRPRAWRWSFARYTRRGDSTYDRAADGEVRVVKLLGVVVWTWPCPRHGIEDT